MTRRARRPWFIMIAWLIPVAAAAVVTAAVTLMNAPQPDSATAPRASGPTTARSADIAPPHSAASLPTTVKTPSSRPPLRNPPDPGPVPAHHGIAATDLIVAADSSVRISGSACGALREGSGFAVGDGDLVATSAHVIADMNEPEVDLADGRTLPGVLVALDPVTDLAVLWVADADLDPLPLRSTAPDGTVGAVLAWDYEPGADPRPTPSPFRIDRPVIVRTAITPDTKKIERRSWLVAAHITSGHSGAALVAFDRGEAEVIGVAWGTSRRDSSGVGYATRADELESLVATADPATPLALSGCDRESSDQ